MASPSSESGPGYDERKRDGSRADKMVTEPLNHPESPSGETSSSQGAPEPAPGNIPKISRYRDIRRVGEGGMAEVYLAHDEVLGRDVALKVLRRGPVDEQLVERFRREARNAASLSQANIVSIYDWGEAEDGSYYLVMEYVPGGTVKGLIDREGPLSSEKAVSIATQTARALETAHRRGLVHRDIKPQNILIDGAGDVKVTDFGIARLATTPSMTEPGSIVGTAHYISPEQATGDPVGPESDLYSLGVVLYEMLTGQVPYDAEDPVAILMKHVEGHLESPKELNPDVPDSLDDITTKLLAKKGEDRYADTPNFIEALERVSGESSRNVGDASVDQQTWPDNLRVEQKRRSRFPLVAGLAGLLTVLMVGLGIWLLGASSWSQELSLLDFGTEMIEVPDVNGESRERAKEILESQGFGVSTDSRESSVEYEGRVVRQVPSGGELAEGETVEIWIGQGPPPEEDAELLRDAVKDYYGAVDREEWGYTYDNLDSKTRALFTKGEWARRNQFFADNYPAELKSLRASVEINPSEPVDVTVYRTWKSGSGNVRDTLFVYEGDSWKHRFLDKERDLFQPEASYEEFVSYHGGA